MVQECDIGINQMVRRTQSTQCGTLTTRGRTEWNVGVAMGLDVREQRRIHLLQDG